MDKIIVILFNIGANMNKIKFLSTKTHFGFTLAEVLITLGIIGVVAAITIPTLNQRNFEKQTVSKLRETQSIISQAVRMAEQEYGDVDGWGLTGADSKSAIIIADKLKPYLKLAADCGINDTSATCVTDKDYKQLKGTRHGDNYATKRADCYKIALLNGTSIWWKGPQDDFRKITFWIDVNGPKQPNTYGKDLFVFSYENYSIRPLGAPDSDSPWEKSCTKNGNGWGCAFYVLNNQNMNYLH